MDEMNIAESLNRTLKMVMDSGEAASMSEAERIFEGYRLFIDVGPNVTASPTLQAALLTAINTARRCFLGGVFVTGSLDSELKIPWKRCKMLSEAVRDLRGKEAETIPPNMPVIAIGGAERRRSMNYPFAVRATFEGWSGGVIPLESGDTLPEKQEFTPAGVLAGALSVSEAFQHIRGNQVAGKRKIGLSLWKPEPGVSWLDSENVGPTIEKLPSRLWLIGLGHLGQAFLWTMGFLPYAHPDTVCLVLQDFDDLSTANDSTSPLTFHPLKKEKKTRAIAKWCEERGFSTIINETRFEGNFKLSIDQPMVAVCGVDNYLARAALEDVGFSRIIEAGLGGGLEEFLSFQVHTFPGPQRARERWGGYSSNEVDNHILQKPAYETLAREGLDKCGLTTLAGRAVGACFVGAATSALVIAELLRMVHGWHAYALIDGNLRSMDRRTAIRNDAWLEPFNPGHTGAGN